MWMHKGILAVAAAVMIIAMAGCNAMRQPVMRHPKEAAADKGPTMPVYKPTKALPATNGATERLLSEARRWLGTPYEWGGQKRGRGADCSGFVMEVFLDGAGMQIPRNAALQSQACADIPTKDLQAGDLVFFANNGHIGHVGIYTGDGRMIHSSSSHGVTYTRLDDPYWAKRYHHAGRLIAAASETAEQRWQRRQRIQAAIDAEIEAMLNQEQLNKYEF